MTRIARVAARAQRELDIAKIEMVKSASVATATQKLLDIARGETRSLNKVISGLQQRLDVLEACGSVGSDHPPLESGSSDDGWGPGPGPGRPHAPGGAFRSRPSASAPSLTAPSHHSAGRRNERVPPGSGSEDWRDEWLSAEYHNRRAPPRTPVRCDVPHHPWSQSPWLVDVMVDSGTRSSEETWSGMSVKVSTWTWTWRSSTLARCVVYDGRPLNAAAGAVMRRRTWKEYGVNIWVQRTWRNRGVATEIPWRGWTWRPWESVGEADGTSVDLTAGVHGL